MAIYNNLHLKNKAIEKGTLADLKSQLHSKPGMEVNAAVMSAIKQHNLQKWNII